MGREAEGIVCSVAARLDNESSSGCNFIVLYFPQKTLMDNSSTQRTVVS